MKKFFNTPEIKIAEFNTENTVMSVFSSAEPTRILIKKADKLNNEYTDQFDMWKGYGE